MIPLLRKHKMLGEVDNPSNKGLWTKKYVDAIPLLKVKITRYNSSRQVRKEPSKLTIRDATFWKKEKLHEKKGTYISHVSIHAYWSWCITFILDRSVSHRHLFLSGLLSPHHSDSMLSSPIFLLFECAFELSTILGSVFSNPASFFSAPSSTHFLGSVFSNPTSFWVRLTALTSLVVCFLTLPPFSSAPLSPHLSGSAFSKPISFRVHFSALVLLRVLSLFECSFKLLSLE